VGVQRGFLCLIPLEIICIPGILLSLSLHFYLLYLLLNSCDGNGATPGTERGDEYHNVIDEAVDQWKKRLCACVKVNGRHFEYMLT